MNTENRYALAAARVLREQLPIVEPVSDPDRRDRVVAAMELALAQQSRRRRMTWAGSLTLAAAAGVLLVVKLASSGGESIVVEQAHGQGNLLLRQGQTRALASATPLLEGDEIHAGETGDATLGLGRGTTLAFSGSSRVRVSEARLTRRFLLLHGQVKASVAKLRNHERLLVNTPDSEVEVRGTRFSVEVADAPAGCGGAKRSRVTVQEGTVWVRVQGSEQVLGAGQTYTRPCASVTPPVEAEPAKLPVVDESRKPAASSAPRRRVPGVVFKAPQEAPEPESRLSEQNDLLSSAMSAARAGQHEVALRRLDELLARYPEGPLSETARVERQRIKAAQPDRF